jgi:hypothetical protein
MSPRVTAKSARLFRAEHAQWRADREAKGWVFHEDLHLEGRLPLTRGRLFRVRGLRGWFKFDHARTAPDGQAEVHCFGPCNKAGVYSRNHYRTFDADRVVRVARKVLPPSRLSTN